MRAADLPLQYNAVDILERNLTARWDKVAIYSHERDVSFREASREVNRVGRALLDLGVRPGECVGLLCPDEPTWVSVYFGAIKIGAVAASFNTLLTPKEYAYMLDDCRARVLVVHESLLPKVEGITAGLEHVVVIGDAHGGGRRSFAEWTSHQPDELSAARTHRDDPCTLNYSSGTTGEPKGIFHAQKDLPLTADLWGVNVLGLTEADRTFAVAKLFFTFGTGGNLIFPWYVGAGIVLFSGSPRVATNVLEVVDKFKPTVLYNAPTGYAAMMAVSGFPEGFDLSSLRICVSAGESLPAPIWQGWKERTGLDILDGIGSTENFHIFLSNRPGDIRPGSSGKPFEGYDLRIVDEEGREVPQGEVGNLQVRGETAALAYLHQYERSKDSFLGPWLNTGDKYRVDEDGYYWHAGRSDDMLKVGGIWVSPMEVESTLLGHSLVLECAVVGHEDRSGLVKPKAYVVLKDGVEASEEVAEELVEYCRGAMAGYKRPRWIEFIGELPKTATGKIQRFKLRA